MQSTTSLYNLERLISLRHDLHKHAELFFEEVQTQAKILEYLSSLGIKEDSIKKVAKTGIIVDISGTAPPSGYPFCVALRADMDGLPIQEENRSIEYESKTKAAHMCGHDMHMTCLLGGASLLLEKLDQIPSDKKIRLLFQPAEEYVGGAMPMIKEGALEGVNEVYGFHNWPWGKPGKMYVRKGFMMATITDIRIVIHGKGGHSALKDELKDPLQPAVDIQVGLRGLVKDMKKRGEKFSVSLPYLRTGDAHNAISDTCEMKGLFRSFGDEFTTEFKTKFKNLAIETCMKYGCTALIEISERYPPVFNTDAETEHVIRVGKKVLGEANVGDDDRLPVYGGEDFAYFVKEKPGAFFFLSSQRKDGDVLHSNNFDPHDDLVALGSEMWLRLVEDRFKLKFK